MSGQTLIENRLKKIGSPYTEFTGERSIIKQWNAYLQKFSLDIEEYYNDNKQTAEELEEKMDILHEIEEYVKEHVFNEKIDGIQYKVNAVVPFGSSASALGMKDGDLDLTICVNPPLGWKRVDEIPKRTNAILAKILKHIESGEMMKDREFEMEHISEARVPIVTGTIDDIEVDISISMTTLVSAQYLAAKYVDAYAKYDRKFILLAAFVKHWQKSMKTDENEEYYRTVFPNSCSTVLMVVFFMKYYKLLPNVTKKHKKILGAENSTLKKVNGGENGSYGIPNIDVANWKRSNPCDASVGTLFLLYLDFYLYVANLDKNKLVIKTGELMHKNQNNFNNYRTDRILIDDVGDKQNPARAVTQISTYKKMLREASNIVMASGPEKIEHQLMKMEL